jgi:Zn-dependent protease
LFWRATFVALPKNIRRIILQYLALIIAMLCALCVSLPVHEWAHAWVANKEGDPTAKMMGRMTLAPHAHFDLWGFLSLAIFHFGWAKPVPVDARNFRRGKTSGFLVSIAGICANLVVGTIAIIIYTALETFVPTFASTWGFYGICLYYFLVYMIQLNFVLAFFNILPIYPLDGFRIVETYSRPNNGYVRFMYRYSTIILIMLVVFSGILNWYLNNTAYQLMDGIIWVFEKFWGLMV